MVWICFWQNCFNFKHTYHWKESNEEQKEGSEQTESADKGADIDPSRMKHSPSRGGEVAGERGGNNHEALEPHTHVWELNDDPDPEQVCAEVFEPEELW